MGTVIDKVWATVEYMNWEEQDQDLQAFEDRMRPGAVLGFDGEWHAILQDETPYPAVMVFQQDNGRVVFSDKPF